MKRRAFIIFGGAAFASPLIARAQPPAMPVIGFISSTSAAGFAFYVAAFREGLKQAGYFEGWNVAIDYRWAEGDIDRLPALAADLISRKVNAIFADSRSAAAAKAATSAIPIVFSSGGDPIKLGLVTNLDRPGGNVTGVSFLVANVVAKRLQILKALVPKAATIGYLFEPENLFARDESQNVDAAARALGLRLYTVSAGGVDDLEVAFAAFARRRVDAVVVGGGAKFITLRDRIVALAARFAMPAIYALRPSALSGGLMSFGPSLEDANRQCGVYVARVLKGIMPATMPVVRSSKVELVINLKTAKTLGLTVPQTLLIAADEVIE